jgi:anthranilate/para-aminobenzoate synthase component I
MATQEVQLAVSPTALLTRCAGQPFACALDGGNRESWGLGRALLAFRPRATLRVAPSGAAVMRHGNEQQCWRGDPFALLDRFCAAWRPSAGEPAKAFGGGVVAALSYDLRRWVERVPARARGDLNLPVLHAAFYDWLLSYSYTEHRYTLASSYLSAAELRTIADELRTLATAPVANHSEHAPACAVPDLGKEEYLAAVQAALEYIAAGDVYQVNLSQRFVVTHPPVPAALFASLQRAHPMPYAAYVGAGDFALVSNSPECFLAAQDGVLATFPIKGTRARRHAAHADACQTHELSVDPKECAEHVMIVDLERNDLGKVCCTGSVRVDEFARVRTFPSLHHMVSKVSGRLRLGTTLAEIMHATFPGGSITGAPKIRAVQIIDELEPVGRDFYTGAIGFIGLDGQTVFNLAIRTAVATPHMLTYHAGGGIVADSVPAREYDETLLKAQPFFAALGSPPV